MKIKHLAIALVSCVHLLTCSQKPNLYISLGKISQQNKNLLNDFFHSKPFDALSKTYQNNQDINAQKL